ncbi:LON peptidase substrate-binding domain-containing protein [Vibrio palustris]|uniref:ATP-dependent protease La (LON) domain protein n=1 Tax=Vibrio palustris TaxID=1918946 RepID=A0A1R4AZW4_9VIBR|nr:LON peptidase substrate-binding domain-containing protein [Vibrio palustris]SJL82201.1 ATP-dependent protease La (LON) domain protein [Vibrio palustris]
MSTIMLFPLGSIVMPEGKMALRIFEPRYQRMVAESMKTDSCFGLCLSGSNGAAGEGELSQFGTWVKIVDFERLDDGLLGITVVGIKRFRIHSITTESDGLRIADVEWHASWPMQEMEKKDAFLAERLQDLYQEIPQVGQLYPHCFFDDASWVTQRWLELMPLTHEQFDQLSRHDDCQIALSYLRFAMNDD